MTYQVKVHKGALDIYGDGKSIILRGVIDTDSFSNMQIAPYQRERRSTSKLKGMINALVAGEQLPDIEIGVRGDDYMERKPFFYLENLCFIIDGLQRLTACERVIAQHPGMTVRLGAMFHFNTTEAWERTRFKAVNGGEGGRVAVSPNVLLRNSADESKTVAALISMSANDKEFILRNKVGWGQNKARCELVTALSLLKTIGHLHSHFGPGRSSRYDELMRACDKTYILVGPQTWRANIREFFALIDRAFGLAKIAFVDLSPHIKFNFLRTLAQVLADHSNFWVDSKLVIHRRDDDKLRQFPIHDPGIIALIGSGGSINPLLYQRLVAHFNSGRRTNQLTKWNGQAADGILGMDSGDDKAEEPEFQDTETPADALVET